MDNNMNMQGMPNAPSMTAMPNSPTMTGIAGTMLTANNDGNQRGSGSNGSTSELGSNRQMLTKRIQICDFICDETALYLDTHPTDKIALDYFAKYLAMAKEASAEYAKKYGSMSHSEYIAGENWKWVENPWPWERNEG